MDLLQVLEHLGVTVGSLHDVTDHSLGQGLGGPGLPHDEERNAEVDGNDHHPDILLNKTFLKTILCSIQL